MSPRAEGGRRESAHRRGTAERTTTDGRTTTTDDDDDNDAVARRGADTATDSGRPRRPPRCDAPNDLARDRPRPPPLRAQRPNPSLIEHQYHQSIQSLRLKTPVDPSFAMIAQSFAMNAPSVAMTAPSVALMMSAMAPRLDAQHLGRELVEVHAGEQRHLHHRHERVEQLDLARDLLTHLVAVAVDLEGGGSVRVSSVRTAAAAAAW